MLVEDKYIGYKVETLIDAKLNKNGKWEVKHKLIQSRSEDLDEWDKREINIESSGNDLERTVQETAVTIAVYLEQVKGDLFEETKELDEGVQ